MRLAPRTFALAAALTLIVAAAAVYATGIARGPTGIAQRAVIGGPIALTSSEGKPFTSADLGGKPFAIFFGFTRCPNVCPTTLSDLTVDMAELGPLADRFRVLFVSIDPERDTPASMKEYLSSFDPRILGLTGTPEQIAGIAKDYKVFYEKVPTTGSDYTMNHTATVYLMAADGSFTSTISFQEDHGDQVAKLKRLATSASPSA